MAPTYALDPAFAITAKFARSYTFTGARAEATRDGYAKQVYAVNGQMPGPLAEADVGDTIEVTVVN